MAFSLDDSSDNVSSGTGLTMAGLWKFGDCFDAIRFQRAATTQLNKEDLKCLSI
jgi:hypothetical protein